MKPSARLMRSCCSPAMAAPVDQERQPGCRSTPLLQVSIMSALLGGAKGQPQRLREVARPWGGPARKVATGTSRRALHVPSQRGGAVMYGQPRHPQPSARTRPFHPDQASNLACHYFPSSRCSKMVLQDKDRLAVPGRPIRSWSRRTGAPRASAIGRDWRTSVCAGSVPHRDPRGSGGHQRSPRDNTNRR
jgi:hypothetical protein